ncbi:MAG: DNA repair protein RecN [Christensenellales bacterium]
MLKELVIKNIAIISELRVQLDVGLNVFSGETGAGKSIIIDSINFVLGKRADKSLIRYNQPQASVCATFDISDCIATKKVLEDIDVDNDDDELVIKRTMTVDGKNTCSINGSKINLALLRQVTTTLVDVYGQHESTAMLDENNHLDILDEYGKEQISAIKDKQLSLYQEYKGLVAKLDKYGSLAQINKNIDLLTYQINEIDAANLKEGEEEELINSRNIMNNSQKIVSALSTAYNLIDQEEGSVLERLAISTKELERVADDVSEIDAFVERLDSCQAELKDLSSSLQELAEECEFDQNQYDRIEERLSTIRQLKKKYGSSVDEILQYQQQLQEEYDFYSDGEAQIQMLQKQIDKVKVMLIDNSISLSNARRKTASELGEKIVEQLQQLGMKNCRFETLFDVDVDSDDLISKINSDGFDKPVFMFSANAGQPPRELSKIISGGELSRFMLAVKSTIAETDGVYCMIFDEIDSGISGRIAQVVAEKLYEISKCRQVLAITHLPQLASMADVNYLIDKQVVDGQTNTTLVRLDEDSLIQEIARLIGGSKDSTLAVAHAKELKQNANQFKKLG